MSDLLPGLLLADVAWAALSAVILALTLLLLPRGSREQKAIANRVRHVRSREALATPTAATIRAGSVRRVEAPTVLGSIGRTLSALVPRGSVLRDRLDRAGMALAVTDFLLIAAAIGVVTGLLLYWRLGPPIPIAACAAVMAAVLLPGGYVRRRVRRREGAFLTSFPDALDLVVRGVRSGLPVTEALNSISHEMPQPTSGIFRDLCANIQIGMSLAEALAVAERKMDLAEFRFFSISLVVQQETGGNLAEILQNLGMLLRRRQQMRLKIRAMSSEARASAMIIGSLPFLTGFFIYLINPGYISTLFTDPRGMILLGCAVGSMGMGLGVMSKMVKFDI